jgi:NAD-dependent deacetylase sirtuin 2
VSVPSGIPDFRSKGGLYDTLKPELLTATENQKMLLQSNPTAVVDIQLFQYNQFPYLEGIIIILLLLLSILSLFSL